MSSRWSEQDEDSARLPEGFKRIGYDADTQRYTFRDETGQLYEGEPGVRYGVMKPIPSPVDVVKRTRPSAFARSHIRSATLPTKLDHEKSPRAQPQTFQDFLPAELITSSTPPISETPTPTPASEKSNLSNSQTNSNSNSNSLVDLVRKSTIPKMQGVVTSLRRSVTSISTRRSRLRPHREETETVNNEEDLRGSTAPASASNSDSNLVSASASGLDRSTSVPM